MKKNIWIWNHYATEMYKNKGGRHYWFAENLKKKGYEPTIFCSNVRHNSDESIDLNGKVYKVDSKGMFPFVFVKTRKYKSNGKDRVLNMCDFYHNMFKVAKKYAKDNGKPDIILASSVHPLTLVAGIKIAKKFGVPCICEIRDLWPLSLVELGKLKSKSMINKVLYKLEKWIYTKSDAIVFTMEGGKQYIMEQGWDKENGGPVNLEKVHHINNGVDLEQFDYNKEHYTFEDEDLDDDKTYKIIYTGTIGKVNNVDEVVKVAEILKSKNYEKIKFIIYGEGSEKERLEKYCYDNKINNVFFKGRKDKKYIPYILSKGKLNFIHLDSNEIYKYGISANKTFEYLASEKPIIVDNNMGYDYITNNNCGVSLNGDVEEISNKIIEFYDMDEKRYDRYCLSSKKTANNYDFKKLTEKLIDIIKDV